MAKTMFVLFDPTSGRGHRGQFGIDDLDFERFGFQSCKFEILEMRKNVFYCLEHFRKEWAA